MSLRRLSLEEWFLTLQLSRIDRDHFFVTGFIEADLSQIRQAWKNASESGSFPLTHILVKALALTLKHVPEANRQYVKSFWGPRMLESNDCSVTVPVMLQVDQKDYLSVMNIKQADQLSIQDISKQIQAYRKVDKRKLIAGKFIVGKRNNLFNRTRLRLLHGFVNAFPQLQDKMGFGLASASSLVNLEHDGTQAVLMGRGPGFISLTACHFDETTGKARIGLAFDHFACAGLVMGKASITLCRILQAELEPEALLP